MLTFRELRADEIELRVGQVTKFGITLLLYQDARAAATILDETVGPLRWRNSYSRDNRNCTIEIYDDERKQWVAKEDTGTESNTEAEKGLASDSFKRAAVKWGIGRALYSAPRVNIKCPTIADGRRFKVANYSDQFGYSVGKIEYSGGKITELQVVKDGRPVFYWHEDTFAQDANKPISQADANKLRAFLGDREANALRQYGHDSLEQVTVAEYAAIIGGGR